MDASFGRQAAIGFGAVVGFVQIRLTGGASIDNVIRYCHTAETRGAKSFSLSFQFLTFFSIFTADASTISKQSRLLVQRC